MAPTHDSAIHMPTDRQSQSLVQPGPGRLMPILTLTTYYIATYQYELPL